MTDPLASDLLAAPLVANLATTNPATVMIDDSRGGFDLRGITIRLRPSKVVSWNLRDTAQGRVLRASGEFQPLGGR